MSDFINSNPDVKYNKQKLSNHAAVKLSENKQLDVQGMKIG